MHNVRRKRVRLTAPHLKLPRQLDSAHCTPQKARGGLAESAVRCTEMLTEARSSENDGRVEKFLRDGWGRPWPVGVGIRCYMLCSGIGKSCGKSAGRLVVLDMIPFARQGLVSFEAMMFEVKCFSTRFGVRVPSQSLPKFLFFEMRQANSIYLMHLPGLRHVTQISTFSLRDSH